MSRKQKLLSRLSQQTADFTWAEAVSVMRLHGFKMLTGSGGSGRRFIHQATGIKVLIHEPHPGNIVKKYAQQNLLDGLKNAGEIE